MNGDILILLVGSMFHVPMVFSFVICMSTYCQTNLTLFYFYFFILAILKDFGVAYVQPDDCTDTILTSHLGSGTKQYLAPEVFCKQHIHGVASDFWALGVTAYELLYSGSYDDIYIFISVYLFPLRSLISHFFYVDLS